MWSMQILAQRGVIKAGKTQIELVPDRKRNVSDKIRKESQSTTLKANGGPDSIEWNQDHQLYSPSSLLKKLENRHGFTSSFGVCKNWQILGHGKSIHHEAH